MQQQPGSHFNPYAPPTADIDQGLHYGADEYLLAGRGLRLGSALIDGLLTVASALPAGVVLFIMISSRRGMLADSELLIYGMFGVMGLMVLAFMGFQWYLISTTGQSLAKRWLGIKIVRVDGSPLGFAHGVILRSWIIGALGNIPSVGPIISLVNALMIFGDERRCLHDHIAGTRVIVAPIE